MKRPSFTPDALKHCTEEVIAGHVFTRDGKPFEVKQDACFAATDALNRHSPATGTRGR